MRSPQLSSVVPATEPQPLEPPPELVESMRRLMTVYPLPVMVAAMGRAREG